MDAASLLDIVQTTDKFRQAVVDIDATPGLSPWEVDGRCKKPKACRFRVGNAGGIGAGVVWGGGSSFCAWTVGSGMRESPSRCSRSSPVSAGDTTSTTTVLNTRASETVSILAELVGGRTSTESPRTSSLNPDGLPSTDRRGSRVLNRTEMLVEEFSPGEIHPIPLTDAARIPLLTVNAAELIIEITAPVPIEALRLINSQGEVVPDLAVSDTVPGFLSLVSEIAELDTLVRTRWRVQLPRSGMDWTDFRVVAELSQPSSGRGIQLQRKPGDVTTSLTYAVTKSKSVDGKGSIIHAKFIVDTSPD